MSKHTPGPWIQIGAWVGVEDDDIPDICSCNPESIEQGHLKWDWETAIANARLIAAAPDLLEALQLAMPALEALRKQWPRHTHDDSLDVVRLARAAITKATGGEA